MDKKYKTILADPPWQYRNKKMLGEWGENADGGAEAHYRTMSTPEICSLSLIKTIRDRDCVLFLWGTIPMLPDAFEVMRAWGFSYKTLMIWVKTRTLSMGYWFRVNTEVCLIGKRGGAKAFRQKTPNLFFAPVSRHSRKPERFFQIIDPVVPRPAIELFAREKRDGWDSWGDEIT